MNVFAVVHRPSPIVTVVASGDSSTILDVDAPLMCLGFMVWMPAAAIAFLAILEIWSTLHLVRRPAFVLANISGCTAVAIYAIYTGVKCSGSEDRCMNSRKHDTVSVEAGTVPRMRTHWENQVFVALVRLEKGSTSFGQ